MSLKDNFSNLITFFQSKFSNSSHASSATQDNGITEESDDLTSWESSFVKTTT